MIYNWRYFVSGVFVGIASESAKTLGYINLTQQLVGLVLYSMATGCVAVALLLKESENV